MRILRTKSFSKKGKKKDNEETRVIKSGAIMTAVPLGISQVATRIDDKVAKKNHKKEVKDINEQAQKLKKEASNIAKDNIRMAEADVGVGKASEGIASMLDSMGIKREPEYPEELQNKLKDNLRKFKSGVKKNLKDTHKQIDDVTNERIKHREEYLRTRLKGNKGIRKVGAVLAAVPAGLTVASVAALKSEKKKQEKDKKEGSKK